MTRTLNLPFLLPPLSGLFFMGLASVAASVTTGVLSALGSALKASRVDIYDNVRDE